MEFNHASQGPFADDDIVEYDAFRNGFPMPMDVGGQHQSFIKSKIVGKYPFEGRIRLSIDFRQKPRPPMLTPRMECSVLLRAVQHENGAVPSEQENIGFLSQLSLGNSSDLAQECCRCCVEQDINATGRTRQPRRAACLYFGNLGLVKIPMLYFSWIPGIWLGKGECDCIGMLIFMSTESPLGSGPVDTAEQEKGG